MQVADDTVVSVHFSLTDADGELIDRSADQEPLAYLHGRGNLIPGLENALAGKAAGENFTLTLEPEQAYGEYDRELVQTIPVSDLEGVDDIEQGMQLETENPDGPKTVWVSKIEGDQVTLDGNHPLAGETLTFEIELVEVREPTENELTHGHVHGPGGHH